MRKTALILCTFFVGLFVCHAVLARSEGIAVVVNDGIVSISDLNDRVRLVMVSSGLANTPDIIERVSFQVLNALIEEQIKLQEAARLEIDVTPDDIASGFTLIAGQNKMAPEQFRDILLRSGINISTMERQIQAQVAWTKIVQSEIRPRITISDSDVDDMLNRISQNEGQTEYLVAQIALPVETPEDDRDIKNLADKLVREIRTGKAPFYKLAQQFSKAPGAAQGGDMGWIGVGQLDKELDGVLKAMDTDTVSVPVRTLEGYSILYLRDKRQMTSDNLPSRDQVITTLGMERLERLQKRYYQDLKAAAFIERRV